MSPQGGTVLVLGASSLVARGACKELAERGFDLILAGRDTKELERLASDLWIRFGRHTSVAHFDALAPETHRAFLASIVSEHRTDLRGVLTFVGWMGDAEATKVDPAAARRVVDVNFTSQVSVLCVLGECLATGGGGFILGVGSVAGDRGRQSNYPYGAAKGGFALWLEGLRHRMHGRGVRVITVKPGFLDTRMTFGTIPGRLAADPAEAGRRIVCALDGRRSVVYYPWYWRWIMAGIRMIPEPIFKRLSL